MPITQSAKKALRQNRTRRVRNVRAQDAYKKAVKEYRSLITGKKMDEARAALAKAFKTLDKGVKAAVIKKNKADRTKSRLAKLLAK